MIRLIGYMDSPFVRRVAVSAHYLAVPYRHEELSIFRDYEKFREINPLVKVPTLITDDGQVLSDSTLIIDYLETLSGNSLMPSNTGDRAAALRVIGVALVANEKVAQLIYETKQRPAEKQHEPWIERLYDQLTGALGILEDEVASGDRWLTGDHISQVDITVAIAWRFVQNVFPDRFPEIDYPGLREFSARAEALPEFVACPLS